MLGWQQDVLNERNALSARIIQTKVVLASIKDAAEQARIKDQLYVMASYLTIINERIRHFSTSGD